MDWVKENLSIYVKKQKNLQVAEIMIPLATLPGRHHLAIFSFESLKSNDVFSTLEGRHKFAEKLSLTCEKAGLPILALAGKKNFEEDQGFTPQRLQEFPPIPLSGSHIPGLYFVRFSDNTEKNLDFLTELDYEHLLEDEKPVLWKKAFEFKPVVSQIKAIPEIWG